MKTQDFNTRGSKINNYPLKIYLSKEDTVVIVFTGLLYGKEFNILNTTCVISKNDFYKAMDSLSKKKCTTIQDGSLSITINITEKNCKITVSNEGSSIVHKEEDTRFQSWLLSIDLRQSKRIKALLPISISSSTVFEYGAILDISTKGFKVAVNNPIPLGTDVGISIFDATFPTGSIPCRIKRETMQNNKYVYGVQILEITEDLNRNLNSIINRESKK